MTRSRPAARRASSASAWPTSNVRASWPRPAARSVIGLHAHLGSGIFDVAHWKSVYADLAALAERFPALQVLDIGGGLGVPHEPGEPALALAELDAALAEVKAMYPRFELWIEPGRYLVAEAGVLLARVTQTKRKSGAKFVGIDAGMHTLLRPALYDAWHQIVNLSRLDARRRWPLAGGRADLRIRRCAGSRSCAATAGRGRCTADRQCRRLRSVDVLAL